MTWRSAVDDPPPIEPGRLILTCWRGMPESRDLTYPSCIEKRIKRRDIGKPEDLLWQYVEDVPVLEVSLDAPALAAPVVEGLI